MKTADDRRKDDADRKRLAYWEDPAAARRRMAISYAKHRATRLAQQREWRLLNLERERARSRKKQTNNPGRTRSVAAQRKAAKLRATPAWANRFFIEEIYDLATLRTKYLGEPHQVDHIVPLQSSLVCGLHVEHNLQVITAKRNHMKSNRVWPEMPI